jgi:hypothetical protein
VTVDPTVRISLWSGPRNVSTALMYSFAQRPDTRVIDEPLYAHYLSRSPARSYHPAAEEVIRTMECDGRRVVQEVLLGDHDRPVVFFKNMAHHLVELEWDFLDHLSNVILTRDPRDMLPSYAAVVELPTLADTGYAVQVQLLEHLTGRGRPPAVLDSSLLLQDPEPILGELCRRLGVTFDPRMLSWEAGPRPEDGVWAPHWYAGVHRSTGFAPYRPKRDPVPHRLQPLLDQCRPLYETLAREAITVTQQARPAPGRG